MRVEVTLNGTYRVFEVEPSRTLATLLSDNAGCPSTHLGCADGTCGACTVVVNGDAVRCCLMLAAQSHNTEILTLEGLAESHPLRSALRVADKVQCGFCLPGLLMLAASENSGHGNLENLPTLLESNMCWCARENEVHAAVLHAASREHGTPPRS